MATGYYEPRLVDKTLDALMPQLPAIVLSGPRGCGKTTTALQRAESVLRLDRRETAEDFRESPDATLADHDGPLLIDGWQLMPESVDAVRRTVCPDCGGGQFLITGDADASLTVQDADDAAVIAPLAMWGLTQGEIERSNGMDSGLTRLFGAVDPTPGMMLDAPLLTDYVEMALQGGFPYASTLPEEARAAWYDDYVDHLVHQDAGELATVLAPDALSRLLRALAINTAAEPTRTGLAAATGVDQRTVRAYLAVLKELCVIDSMPAWGVDRFPRMVKTKKFYLTDTGLAAHLVGDTRAELMTDSDQLNRLIDTFVAAQLRPLLHLFGIDATAHHLRDRNDCRKIDMVLESSTHAIAGVQITAARTASDRDVRHLAWLRDQVGDDFVRGVVLHTGAEVTQLDDKLWAMPIAALWRRPAR